MKKGWKLKNEQYKLFWTDKAEFVRTAIKFKAMIIPVAAVGLEESMSIIFDREEMMNMPIFKNQVDFILDNVPDARIGINNGTYLNTPMIQVIYIIVIFFILENIIYSR